MLRSKHLIAALLVAPLLTILAWFAVGALVAERPAPAQAGRAYPLLEKSSCRYASGVCELENVELRITLRVVGKKPARLHLESSHGLDTVRMAVDEPAESAMPRVMERRPDGAGRAWTLALDALPAPPQRLRLAASRSGSLFYADVSTAFIAGHGVEL